MSQTKKAKPAAGGKGKKASKAGGAAADQRDDILQAVVGSSWNQLHGGAQNDAS
jgi:hypothetical protein